jgi:epsilon-lactone hydrolase
MPSFSARVVANILRWTGIYRRMFSGQEYFFKNQAKIRGAPAPEPSAKMRRTLDVRREEFAGRAIWHVGPKSSTSKARLLYFHGGGYLYTAASVHWDFIGHLAEKHGISSIVPLYPLAPEADCLTTTAFALDVYRDLLTRHDAKDVVIGGDSAGAGLTVATAMLARDAALSQPAGLLLLSPWLDAAATHPDQPAIEPRDAILTLRGIRDAGKMYARELPIDDPRVSPIHGDYAGLAPIQMYGGSADILVTDARALKAKLPGVDYVEESDLIHDWPLFTFPESRRAQARIADFVTKMAG